MAALPGEHAAARDVWVAYWKRVAVSDIPGWPLWEKAVHDCGGRSVETRVPALMRCTRARIVLES